MTTDATNAKIDAQKLLIEAEIKTIKTAIYTSGLLLGIIFSVIEILFRVMKI